MAKTIVIQRQSWLARHPVEIRRYLVKLVFSDAINHGWDVVIQGQRWHQAATPPKPAKTHEPMSDADWLMIMNYTPS